MAQAAAAAADADLGASAANVFRHMKELSPLVQCISNKVTVHMNAEALLCAGAAPAMVHATEESPEFAAIANVLCVNVGTLDPPQVECMRVAAQSMHQLNKPWVIDPVACGATTFRTNTCKSLVADFKPTAIRGNASEIMALGGLELAQSRGVETTNSVSEAQASAAALAREHACIVCVSGEVDFVTDGTDSLLVSNGHPLLTKITGAGCTVTTICAAAVAAEGVPGSLASPADRRKALEAVAAAMAIFGLAAERGMARDEVRGPGSLTVALNDELYLMTPEDVRSGVRIAPGPSMA